MPRTAPATQTAGTTITSTIWNDQVQANLEFLLGLKRNGSAITGLADGGELVSNLIASNGANEIASSSGITISSIPATYKHLRLIVTCQSNDAVSGRSLFVRVGNGSLDSTTNYFRQSLGMTNVTPAYNNDVSAGTHLLHTSTIPPSTGLYSVLDMTIFYYAVGGGYRRSWYQMSSSFSAAAADQYILYGCGVWKGTTAIDTVGFLANSGDLMSIKYELYGVV